MDYKINAIIPAGGTSSRFGNKNKLLEKINGKEVIKYTVQAFENSNVDEIIICANVSIINELQEILKDCRKVKIIEGGETRQASVFNGLNAHTKLYGQNFTDDAGMLEELGQTVYILNGSYKNIKITTQNDIDIAKTYL